MNAQLNDTHYTVIAAIHEQMPSHLFMSSGDYNTHTIMWYTDQRHGGKEEHSLRFAAYAEYRAFISALESEGYFAQSSVTGLMFRRDSMRIPASVYKPKQDDREYVDLGDHNASDADKQIAALIHIRRLYDESSKKGTKMSKHFSFHKFWDFVDSVSDNETETGWVEGFSFGKELNEASGEVARIEGLIREILRVSFPEVSFPEIETNFNQGEDEDLTPSTLRQIQAAESSK